MTKAELAELRALAEKATPGEWHGMAYKHLMIWRGESPQVFRDVNAADEAYIKALWPDRILALIYRLEAAEAALRHEFYRTHESSDGCDGCLRVAAVLDAIAERAAGPRQEDSNATDHPDSDEC